MVTLLIDKEKYDILGFDGEPDFEKAVIENSEALFGKETIYVDIKRRIGPSDSRNKGIPDGYLIDFSDSKNPQLYFVENELSTHDVYSHITEQVARFSTFSKTSPNQIRQKLIEHTKKDASLLDKIEQKLKQGPFRNLEELMIFLTERNEIKIVIVIDEETPDLDLSLDSFKKKPDVVILQRFIHNNKIVYYYQPMSDEIAEIEDKPDYKKSDLNFDTIVCPAFEDGFQHAYVQNNAWWAIRISQKAREQLKYLAIYQKTPIGKIQNLAEIDKIEAYKNSSKFIVYLKNKEKIGPIELDKGKKGIAPQGPRFTTYEKIKKVKLVSELW